MMFAPWRTGGMSSYHGAVTQFFTPFRIRYILSSAIRLI